MLRPSGATSMFIQVPLSTAIRTCRVFKPDGAFTSHFAGLAGAAVAGDFAVAGASGDVFRCSGLMTSFSGA